MIVRHMNLQQMCNAAGRIFRGTVLGVTEGTVSAGGGQLPTIVYRIRVDEVFKGTFEMIKGQRIATLQMVRPRKRLQTGPMRSLPCSTDLPSFQEGHDYLILATTPSAVGLVDDCRPEAGSLQGGRQDRQETAVNGSDNIGLNTGAGPQATRGPIPVCVAPHLHPSVRRSLSWTGPCKSLSSASSVLLVPPRWSALGAGRCRSANGPLAVCEPGRPYLWADGGAQHSLQPGSGKPRSAEPMHKP